MPTHADSQAILQMRILQRENTYPKDLMNLPRSVSAVIATFLLHTAVLHAAQNVSCIFDTFSAPSGYTFSQVQGVSDDGTVVGQLVDNRRSCGWPSRARPAESSPNMRPRSHQAPGSTDATPAAPVPVSIRIT
jgi:hypothetical protein